MTRERRSALFSLKACLVAEGQIAEGQPCQDERLFDRKTKTRNRSVTSPLLAPFPEMFFMAGLPPGINALPRAFIHLPSDCNRDGALPALIDSRSQRPWTGADGDLGRKRPEAMSHNQVARIPSTFWVERDFDCQSA